ncbi:MFS transporter [Psychromicrobium lacuslunae]|uniref:MFS transporter n=1 Tax=Psychromicrobium lacuslunae TaxID=1618207 RepID=UPI0006986156|nr:MFS transporter [Psychromicrobium lacuslunae]
MNTAIPRNGLVLAALASGFVMASLDSTVVNVATVAIGDDFGSSISSLTWVVDSYVLSFAALLLLAGSLATSFGSRRLYLIGMCVFLAASIGCATAPNEGWLIAARALEGLGAALFMPSSLALLIGTFTNPGQRAKMLGLWSAMVAASAAIGPTVGGLLVSSASWRSIFLINIPVVLLGIFLTLKVIPATKGNAVAISPLGHLLLLCTVAAAAYLLIQGHSTGLTDGSALAAIAIFFGGGGLLILQQRRSRAQLLPWRLFTRPGFAIPNIVGFLYSGSLYGSLYLMGIFFQEARHLSAFEAGLQLLPMTACFPLGNIIYTRIHHRVSNETIMMCCLLQAGVASLTLLFVQAGTPYWHIALALGLANSGAGLVTAAMTAATVKAAGDEHANHAGAALNTNRQLGVLVGIAVVGLVLQLNSDWYQGFHGAIWLIAAGYLLASLCAGTARRFAKP